MSRPTSSNAPLPTLHQRNISTAATTLTFSISKIAHQGERLLELDVGRFPISVSIHVARFDPMFSGIGPVPDALKRQASMTLYLTDHPTTRTCDYRLQAEVSHTDVAASAAASSDSVFQFESITGTLYMAIFCPLGGANVEISCRLGYQDVPWKEDSLGLWALCKQYNVYHENYERVVDWFAANRTRLVLDSNTKLIHDAEHHRQNPMHVLCKHCGDPRLAKLLVKHCARFINANLEDDVGRTPIFYLLMNPDIYRPGAPRYYRALELVTLLAKEAAVSLDKQDVDGNTVLHYAARYHSRDSKILPLLLECGAASFGLVRNERGRTPIGESQQPEFGRLPVDLVEIQALLERKGQPPPIARTLVPVDSLPPTSGSADDINSRRFGPAVGKPMPPCAFETINALRLSSDPMTPPAALHHQNNNSSSSAVVGLSSSSSTTATGGGGGPRAKPMMTTTRLKAEFAALDADGDGVLSLPELRRAYEGYDSMGVESSGREVEEVIQSLGIADDGKVTFDEYLLLMVKLARR